MWTRRVHHVSPTTNVLTWGGVCDPATSKCVRPILISSHCSLYTEEKIQFEVMQQTHSRRSTVKFAAVLNDILMCLWVLFMSRLLINIFPTLVHFVLNKFKRIFHLLLPSILMKFNLVNLLVLTSRNSWLKILLFFMPSHCLKFDTQ